MLSVHFAESEFACHHCGVIKVARELIDRLERLRDLVGWPINILSGYRCEPYNKSIGGAERSYHVCGMAADIWWDGRNVGEMAHWVRHAGFGGVGSYRSSGGFVHADLGPVRDWTR